LIAYTLIHCLSCGWYMLACPNAADTEIFKCYSYGWAVMKGQSKFCCVFAFFLQSDYLQEGHYLFSFSSIYTIDVIY